MDDHEHSGYIHNDPYSDDSLWAFAQKQDLGRLDEARIRQSEDLIRSLVFQRDDASPRPAEVPAPVDDETITPKWTTRFSVMAVAAYRWLRDGNHYILVGSCAGVCGAILGFVISKNIYKPIFLDMKNLNERHGVFMENGKKYYYAKQDYHDVMDIYNKPTAIPAPMPLFSGDSAVVSAETGIPMPHYGEDDAVDSADHHDLVNDEKKDKSDFDLMDILYKNDLNNLEYAADILKNKDVLAGFTSDEIVRLKQAVATGNAKLLPPGLWTRQLDR